MGGPPAPAPSRPWTPGPAPVAAPVIVKLGGSIITRKNEVERARPKILLRLAEEVAANPTVPLVLLHGAGSFGHPGARRWGLARPPDTHASPRDRARGAAIVQAEVRRLHAKVLAALLEAGANPISIPASTLAENRSGRLERFDPAPFARALAMGTVPVSFGDVVPDADWGFSILSADAIAVSLAGSLFARRVVFVSDVPGVFRTFPNGREIYPELTEGVTAALAPPSGSVDVTGGILGKANAMLRIARFGVDAGLISGLSDGALSRAIRGEAVYGTWTKAASRDAEAARPDPHERA